MTEFLIQDETGRIYVKTDVLAGRKDMKPYEWPAPKDELVDVVIPDPTFTMDMTKDQLCAHAMVKFGVDLNKRSTLETLLKKIQTLETDAAIEEI